MIKIKVIDLDGTLTIYEATEKPAHYGYAGTHVKFKTIKGAEIFIAPTAVRRIEVYETET